MKAFDSEALLRFVCSKIPPKEHPAWASRLVPVLRQIIKLDVSYMRSQGALTQAGLYAQAAYDEDEALEEILDEIVRLGGLNEAQELDLAVLLDAYMAAREAYLYQG